MRGWIFLTLNRYTDIVGFYRQAPSLQNVKPRLKDVTGDKLRLLWDLGNKVLRERNLKCFLRHGSFLCSTVVHWIKGTCALKASSSKLTAPISESYLPFFNKPTSKKMKSLLCFCDKLQWCICVPVQSECTFFSRWQISSVSKIISQHCRSYQDAVILEQETNQRLVCWWLTVC